MPRRLTSRGMEYGEKAVVMCISEDHAIIIYNNLIRMIIMACQMIIESCKKSAYKLSSLTTIEMLI
jgi:hypothetical protein